MTDELEQDVQVLAYFLPEPSDHFLRDALGRVTEQAKQVEYWKNEKTRTERTRDQWREQLRVLVEYAAPWLGDQFADESEWGACTDFIDKFREACDTFGVEYPFKPNYDDAIHALNYLIEYVGYAQSNLEGALGYLEEAKNMMENGDDKDDVESELSSAEQEIDSADSNLREYSVNGVYDELPS